MKNTDMLGKIKRFFVLSGAVLLIGLVCSILFKIKCDAAYMGTEFLIRSAVSAVLAMVFIVIFFAIRFQKIDGLPAGVITIFALIHNLAIAYFTLVPFRKPVGGSFLVVALVILCFTLGETAVLFDQISETKKHLGAKTPLTDIVNQSAAQAKTRIWGAAMIAGFTAAAVIIIAIVFKQNNLILLAVPLLTGIIASTYSAVCLTVPLWTMWQTRNAK